MIFLTFTIRASAFKNFLSGIYANNVFKLLAMAFSAIDFLLITLVLCMIVI